MSSQEVPFEVRCVSRALWTYPANQERSARTVDRTRKLEGTKLIQFKTSANHNLVRKQRSARYVDWRDVRCDWCTTLTSPTMTLRAARLARYPSLLALVRLRPPISDSRRRSDGEHRA